MRLNDFLVLTLLVFAPLADGATIRGRVIDLGAKRADKNGIASVKVVIYDGQEKALKTVSTNARGEYVASMPPASARVWFTKPGYQDRPTEILVTGTDTYKEVLMVREKARRSYYRKVAERIRASDRETRRMQLKVVNELPAEKRLVLAGMINLDMPPERTAASAGNLPRITGAVRAGASAVPGVTVSLFPADACTACPSTCDCAPAPILDAVTQADGRYSFTAPAGRYVIRAGIAGAESFATTVDTFAEKALALDLPIKFEVSESITVTAEAPLVVSGAKPNQPLIFLPKSCESLDLTNCGIARETDAEGRLDTRLPLDEYTIVVPSEAGKPMFRPIDLTQAVSAHITLAPPVL